MDYSVNQWKWAIITAALDSHPRPQLKEVLMKHAKELLESCTPEQLRDAEIKGAKLKGQ